MKRILIGLAVVAVFGFFILHIYGDWFQRHCGFSGYPDRITLFLYSDESEKPIPTYDYELTLCGSDQDFLGPVKDRGKSYSLSGDYGTYYFTLTYQEKTAHFFLENLNNWWRTAVLLRLREDGQGIQQVNCLYNTDPPGIEIYMIDWEDGQTEPTA